jgi:hypothetical protein
LIGHIRDIVVGEKVMGRISTKLTANGTRVRVTGRNMKPMIGILQLGLLFALIITMPIAHTAPMSLENVRTWYWIFNTTIQSMAVDDVDDDGSMEIVTGGYYDDSHDVAQLCVWDGATLALENVQTWYWIGRTVITSVAVGNVDELASYHRSIISKEAK